MGQTSDLSGYRPSPRPLGTQSAATTSQACSSASAVARASASVGVAAGEATQLRGVVTPPLPRDTERGMWYYHHAALADGCGLAPALAPSAIAQVLLVTPCRSAGRSTRHPGVAGQIGIKPV
jgi:hypothetical protein